MMMTQWRVLLMTVMIRGGARKKIQGEQYERDYFMWGGEGKCKSKSNIWLIRWLVSLLHDNFVIFQGGAVPPLSPS